MEYKSSNNGNSHKLEVKELLQMKTKLTADNFAVWDKELDLIIWGQDEEVVAAVKGGGNPEMKAKPTLDDVFDVLTEDGEEIRKYDKTQSGLRQLEIDTAKYEMSQRVSRDLLAKIAKIMWAGMSAQSRIKVELDGRGTMSFGKEEDMLRIDVAKRHPGVLMSLIEKTHRKSNDRDLVRLVKTLMGLKQTQSCPLTQYIAEHCKVRDDIKRAIFGLNNEVETEGLEVLNLMCKAMVLCQVDQTLNLAPLNELATRAAADDKAVPYENVLEMLLMYERQVSGRKEIPEAAGGLYKATIERLNVQSTCTECGKVFNYNINAESGKVFQKCEVCHQKSFELRKGNRVDYKANPNLSRAELVKLLRESDAKAAAKVDVPAKKGVAKVIPLKGKPAAAPVIPVIKAAMLEVDEETIDGGAEYEDEETYYY